RQAHSETASGDPPYATRFPREHKSVPLDERLALLKRTFYVSARKLVKLDLRRGCGLPGLGGRRPGSLTPCAPVDAARASAKTVGLTVPRYHPFDYPLRQEPLLCLPMARSIVNFVWLWSAAAKDRLLVASIVLRQSSIIAPRSSLGRFPAIPKGQRLRRPTTIFLPRALMVR